MLILGGRFSETNTILDDMAIYVDREKFDVKVCYVEGSSDGKTKLDRSGMSIYLDPDGRLGSSAISKIRAIARLFKSENPDIVHCHRYKPTIHGVIAAYLAGGVPVVVSHDHGTNIKRLMNIRRRLVTGLVYRWVSRVVTVSEGGRKDILSVNRSLEPSRVVTVWNGIDVGKYAPNDEARQKIRKELGFSPEDVVFGIVGRLAQKKGHSYLLDAFRNVLDASSVSMRPRLVIAGDGELRGRLEEKARKLGLSSEVLFLGRRGDIVDLLNGFDVFVFPSFSEGLPLALLEAMASRLPIVISDGRGMPEVFGPGGFGRMIPAGDVKALTEAMTEVGTLSEEQRRALGEAARKRVGEAFTKEMMCSRLMDVYEEILAP